MSEAKPSPLEKRFQSAVAAYSKDPTPRNRERMERAEARWYGVEMRHVAKLVRNRRPPDKP